MCLILNFFFWCVVVCPSAHVESGSLGGGEIEVGGGRKTGWPDECLGLLVDVYGRIGLFVCWSVLIEGAGGGRKRKEKGDWLLAATYVVC